MEGEVTEEGRVHIAQGLSEQGEEFGFYLSAVENHLSI